MADAATSRADLRRAKRARRRRRRIVAAATGVAVVGGGSAALAATADSGSSLQLATVVLGTVTQTVESSGTVTASTKETAQFSVSGTVKSVAVAVGDTVRARQTLARIDATALHSAVDSVQASLAAAQQKLSADASGQVASGTTGPGGTTGSGGTTGTGPASFTDVLVSRPVDDSTALAAGVPPTGATTTTKAQAAVIAAQKRVDTGQTELDAAQKRVDTDVTENTKLRDAQVTACGTKVSSPDPSTPTSAECTSASADYAAFADTLAADTAAVDTKLAAQDAYVSGLDTAITALDQAIAQLGSSSGGSSGTGGSSGSTQSGGSSGSGAHSGGPSGSGTKSGSPSGAGTGTPSTGSGSGAPGGTTPAGGSSGSASSGGQPASASQLAADQASIDSLTAQLTAARRNLAAATLSSPIAGTVAAVAYSPGASSSDASITIVGTGVAGVQTSVPLGQIDSVKIGEAVAVAADGHAALLHGTVVSIGLLSTTSGSRTTFPVTVRLDAESPAIRDGSGADVVITTGSAKRVTAVPTSAVHTGAGGTHTVTVANGSKQSTVRVSIGLTGPDLTQITSDLKQGEKVVLADLSQPLPGGASSSTTTTGRFGGGAGGGFAGRGGTGAVGGGG